MKFFCCGAPNKKNKNNNASGDVPPPISTTQSKKKKGPEPLHLRDTVFVVGKGWVPRPQHSDKTTDLTHDPKARVNSSHAEEKEDALDMLQIVAEKERKRDVALEDKLRETQQKLIDQDRLRRNEEEHQKEIVLRGHNVVSYHNIHPTGDDSPVLYESNQV